MFDKFIIKIQKKNMLIDCKFDVCLDKEFKNDKIKIQPRYLRGPLVRALLHRQGKSKEKKDFELLYQHNSLHRSKRHILQSRIGGLDRRSSADYSVLINCCDEQLWEQEIDRCVDMEDTCKSSLAPTSQQGPSYCSFVRQLVAIIDWSKRRRKAMS